MADSDTLVVDSGTRPSNTIPLLSALGTYDVIYGRHASARSVKSEVINWDELTYYPFNVGGKEYQVPRGINAILYHRKTYEASFVTEIEEEYSFFSDFVTADFSDEERNNLSNVFTKISYNVPLYILNLPMKDEIRNILIPKFLRALDDGDPEDLYENYGTHLVNSIVVGGRVRFLYATNTTKYSSKIPLKVAVEASVKSLMGRLDAQQEMKYKDAIESVQASSTYKIITEGGGPGYEPFLGYIGNWASSIIDWPASIDFGSQPHLLPFYDLVTTPERRTQLEEAYKAYCKTAPSSLGIDGPYLEVRPFPSNQVACKLAKDETPLKS